jgi:hypothetical protein
LQPERVTPLATALRNASKFAVDAMRSGKLDPLSSDAAVADGAAASAQLATLHREQQRLAGLEQTDEVEAAYAEIVAKIAVAEAAAGIRTGDNPTLRPKPAADDAQGAAT